MIHNIGKGDYITFYVINESTRFFAKVIEVFKRDKNEYALKVEPFTKCHIDDLKREVTIEHMREGGILFIENCYKNCSIVALETSRRDQELTFNLFKERMEKLKRYKVSEKFD